MRRGAAGALLALTLEATARVAAAQSSDTMACRGSVDRKAVVARTVDARTAAPVLRIIASLEAQRPDTISGDSGITVFFPFRRRPRLDASGQLCFENLRAGEYRLVTRAVGWDASEQAIIVHLSRSDTLKSINLGYGPFGRSPEEERRVAEMLHALDVNRRRWVQSRPPHYLVRVRRDCGCFEGPPKTYEVLDGVAVATIDGGGVRHVLSENSHGVTVDSVFDALRANLLDERKSVDVLAYDRRFGWPSQYRSDSRAVPELSSGWEKVTIERFDVIP